MGDFDARDPRIPSLGQQRVQPAAPYRPDLDNIGFEALGDVIVAVLDEADQTTAGGIVIPAQHQKQPFHIALSCGPDVKGVSPGDRIMATGGASMESASGRRVWFFRAAQVLALVHRLQPEEAANDEPSESDEPDEPIVQ